MNHTAQATAEMLAEIALFASLTPDERGRLARDCRLCRFAPGDVLLREGDHAAGLYVVRKGVVKMIGLSPEGRETVLHLVRQGNTLGEGSVFQRGNYPATAVAAGPGEALYVGGEALIAMILENPDLALRMLAALSLRLRMFTRKLTNQARGGAERRLAAYLLHRRQLAGNDPVIRLGVSREVLAGLLGFSRETLSRKMSRLVESGAIRTRGRDVIIENEALLRVLAETGD